MKYLIFALLVFCQVGFTQSKKDIQQWEQNLEAGYEFLTLGNFNKAQPLLEKAYELSLKIFDNESQSLSSTAFYYGFTEFNLENYEKAIKPLEDSKIFYTKTSTNQEGYPELLSYLASAYLETDQFKLAEPYYLESSKIVKENFGANHINYGIALTNLAGFYKDISEYKKALEYFNQGMDILVNKPEFPIQYYNNIRYNYLPFIYEGLVEIDKAIEVNIEALTYISSSLGKSSSNYANIKAHLGFLYISYGQSDVAENLLLEAADIFIKLGDEHLEALGNVYMGLCSYYNISGNYEKALEYATLGIQHTGLLSDVLPKNHINYFQILGDLYQNLGQNYNAIDLYSKAVEQSKKTYGEKYHRLFEYQSTLGLIHLNNGDYEIGKQLLYEAFNNAKLAGLNETDETFWFCSYNLLPALVEDNKIEEAINLIENNLKYVPKNLTTYYTYIGALAQLHILNRDCQKAKLLLEQLKAPLKELYGNQHSNYINIVNSLIQSEYCLKNFQSLEHLIQDNSKNSIEQIKQVFNFSSNDSKRDFLNSVQNDFNLYLSIAFHQDQLNQLHEINLNNHLFLKGILLKSSQGILKELSTVKDANVKNDLEKYTLNKYLLTRVQNTVSLENTTDDYINELFSLVAAYESRLTQYYNQNFDNKLNSDFTWRDVQKTLKENDIAIDFAYFTDYFSENVNEPKVQYIAYVFDKNSTQPVMIKLFEESDLKTILNQDKSPNNLYKHRGAVARGTANINNKQLYDLIFKPLMPFFKGKTNIYYVLDGLLHQIAIAAIQDENNNYLLNQFDFHLLSSLQNIQQTNAEFIPSNIALFGGIEYNYEEKINQSLTKSTIRSTTFPDVPSSTYNTSWEYLPGTLSEVNSIVNLIEKEAVKSSILSGKQATESQVKKMDKNAPEILHIATHGFFFEQEKNVLNRNNLNNNIYKSSNNPLVRSGLLFYGANYAWVHGDNPFETENGILTAQEISNLDLSNTKLVVLSACETGLGVIDGNEGVYGLQRSFKMAGVNEIIMSLWQVPDKETAEFMTLFYKNWFETKTLNAAFIQTQKQMQQTYPVEPLKWAGFVLVN